MATVSGTFKAHPDAALIWVDAHAVSRSRPHALRGSPPPDAGASLVFMGLAVPDNNLA